MKQPQIGEIWTPVNSTRFGDVEVLSNGIDYYGETVHTVMHIGSGQITEGFNLVNGFVEFIFKSTNELENE